MCLIKKPYKTRHVKQLNLCVKEFHFYSKFFDKIVFGANFKWFLLGLLLSFPLLVALEHVELQVKIPKSIVALAGQKEQETDAVASSFT